MPVPDDWWKEACEVVHHPMACVGMDNKFIWVNSAFENLTGYSHAELLEKTWMDITVQEDVGGDLASVAGIINGNDEKYTISKRYRHKHGKDVPVALTVWRFPREIGQAMACFIVEAYPENASVLELEKLRNEMHTEVINLRLRLERLEPDPAETLPMFNQSADRSGRNSVNSTGVVVVLAGVVMIAVLAMAAMFLGGSMTIKKTPFGGAVEIEGDNPREIERANP